MIRHFGRFGEGSVSNVLLRFDETLLGRSNLTVISVGSDQDQRAPWGSKRGGRRLTLTKAIENFLVR